MRRPEQDEQIALMRWAILVQVGEWKLSDLLWHYPAGGWRSPAEAAIFKAMGTQDGVPDLVLPIANETYIGGWWELKAGRNQCTPSQVEKHALLRRLGHYVQTYWHWHEAAQDIVRYLRTSKYTIIERARL